MRKGVDTIDSIGQASMASLEANKDACDQCVMFVLFRETLLRRGGVELIRGKQGYVDEAPRIPARHWDGSMIVGLGISCCDSLDPIKHSQPLSLAKRIPHQPRIDVHPSLQYI